MKYGKHWVYARFIKRSLDILCSTIVLLLFSWLYALIAVLVRCKLGKPVLFKQIRPGKDGKPFAICKFRTMTDQRDASGKLLPDDVRLTRFGNILRKTSLDELPEVWNILTGSMSVVGPRPLLMEYLPYYTAEERRRHDVRPGLTGLAQISGRNYIEWDARLAKDIEYVDHVSFSLDARIAARTVLQLFKRQDVAENTNAVEGNFAEIRKNRAVEAVKINEKDPEGD